MSERYNQLLKRWKNNIMSGEPAAVRHAKALKIENKMPVFAKGETIRSDFDVTTIDSIESWKNDAHFEILWYYKIKYAYGKVSEWIIESTLITHFSRKPTARRRELDVAKGVIAKLQELRSI